MKFIFVWLFLLSQAKAASIDIKQGISCLLKVQLNSLKAASSENNYLFKTLDSYRQPNIEAGVKNIKDIKNTQSEVLGDVYIAYSQSLFDDIKSDQRKAYDLRQSAETQEIKDQLALLLKSAIELSFEQAALQNQIRISQQRKSRYEKIVGYLEDLTKAKASDGADLLFAQSESLKVQSEIGALQIQMFEASAKQKQLTGGLNFEINTEDQRPHPSETDPQHWLGKQDQIPSVLKENLRASSYREEKKSYRLPWLPKTDLELNVDAYGYGRTSDPLTTESATLKFSWALWDKKDRQNQNARTALLANVYEEKAKLAKLKFSTEVDLIQKSIQERIRLRQTLKKRIEVSSKASDLAWLKFRLKKMTYLQFRDAEQALADSQAQLKQAELDLALLRARLAIWDEFSSPDFFNVNRPDCLADGNSLN